MGTRDRKKREVSVVGNLVYVPLTRGFHATVDLSDLHLVEGRNWHVVVAPRTHYAFTHIKDSSGEFRKVAMHRLLLGAAVGVQVDHKDCDGLNNRRKNLRTCSHPENQQNSYAYSNNTSGRKGVDWHKGKWRSRINVGGGSIFLGNFSNLGDAHEAYKAATLKYHREFARHEK